MPYKNVQNKFVSFARKGKITLPSSIELELATNPFLRAESVDEFAQLRSLKDNF